jgi:hypothetical protein
MRVGGAEPCLDCPLGPGERSERSVADRQIKTAVERDEQHALGTLRSTGVLVSRNPFFADSSAFPAQFLVKGERICRWRALVNRRRHLSPRADGDIIEPQILNQGIGFAL